MVVGPYGATVPRKVGAGLLSKRHRCWFAVEEEPKSVSSTCRSPARGVARTFASEKALITVVVDQGETTGTIVILSEDSKTTHRDGADKMTNNIHTVH
jgi:hypothetical protein